MKAGRPFYGYRLNHGNPCVFEPEAVIVRAILGAPRLGCHKAAREAGLSGLSWNAVKCIVIHVNKQRRNYLTGRVRQDAKPHKAMILKPTIPTKVLEEVACLPMTI